MHSIDYIDMFSCAVCVWVCLESGERVRERVSGQVFKYNELSDKDHCILQFDFVMLNCFKVSGVLASWILFLLAVSRHCTRSYWLEKPFREEGEKVILKTHIGMVIMKLCMQSGHLFTCVAQMMQVVLENWCLISFLGYHSYYN